MGWSTDARLAVSATLRLDAPLARVPNLRRLARIVHPCRGAVFRSVR
jgi:hypothetical protein